MLVEQAADASVASISLAVLGSVIFLLVIRFTGAKIDQAQAKMIVSVLSIIFFVLHMLPLLVLDAMPVKSDFLTYWQEAIALANGGNEFPVRSVYERRTLPFLFPLVSLFGDEHTVYQFFNVALLTGMYFSISNFCRVRYGSAAAIATALFLMVVPELYGVVFYAHHDFYGAALLVMCFFLIWKMGMTHVFVGKFTFALLLGLTIWLFWLQRGLHMPVFAALFVFLVVCTRSPTEPGKLRKQIQNWMLTLLIPVVVFQGCMALSKTVGLSDPSPQRVPLSFAVYGNIEAKGGYAFGAGTPVINALSDADKKSVGLEIIARDFLESPAEYLWSRYEKATRLFEFGSNIWFYAPPKKSKAFYRVYSFSSNTFRLFLNFFIVVLGVWTGAKLIRAVVINQVMDEHPALWAGLMVTMIVFSFSMFFETTSRHLIPAYFLLPLFFGGVMTSKPKNQNDISVSSVGAMSMALTGLFLIITSLHQTHQYLSRKFVLIDWRSAQLEAKNIVHSINDGRSSFAYLPSQTNRFLWKIASPNVFGKYDYFVLPEDPTKPSELSLNLCSEPKADGKSLVGFIETIPWDGLMTEHTRCKAFVEGSSAECNGRVQKVTVDNLNDEQCRVRISFAVTEQVGGWRLALFSFKNKE